MENEKRTGKQKQEINVTQVGDNHDSIRTFPKRTVPAGSGANAEGCFVSLTLATSLRDLRKLGSVPQ